MAMNLPNKDLDFVPLDVLTAAEMNKLVANDKYLADFWSKSDSNGVIKSSHLATDSVGSGQIAANAVGSSELAPGAVVHTSFGRFTEPVASGTSTYGIPYKVFRWGNLVTFTLDGRTSAGANINVGDFTSRAVVPSGYRPAIQTHREPLVATASGEVRAMLRIETNGKMTGYFDKAVSNNTYVSYSIMYGTNDPMPS